LTVSPQMSYCGLRAPITPAITGPLFIPEKTKGSLDMTGGQTQHD
jgi:hypothetical protein